jgi:hypothetical protein
MQKSLSYELGKLVSRVSPSVVVWVVLLGVVVAIAVDDGVDRSEPVATATSVAVRPPVDAVVIRCKGEREALLAKYQDLIKVDPWQAATSLRVCAERLQDSQLQSMVKAAERADLVRTEQNPKALPWLRLDALDRLTDLGEPLLAERQTLRADLVKKVALNEALLEKSRVARKKSEGVAIGASMQDAIDSSWGRPERVNRTTTAFGDREQWVYGGGNYLYFQDGVLTTIQTGR